jgi:hypothetical protein
MYTLWKSVERTQQPEELSEKGVKKPNLVLINHLISFINETINYY